MMFNVECLTAKQQHFFKSLIIFCFKSNSLGAPAGASIPLLRLTLLLHTNCKKIDLVASFLLQNKQTKLDTNIK